MMCKCKTNSASFNFKDEILPVEVVAGLYCPRCSGDISYSHETMLTDNGWVIEYDMDVASLMKPKLPAVAAVTPSFLFDEGYCTWRGVYPGDHIDSAREREELLNLAKIDKKKYLEEFKSWGKDRMDRLAREGWRKAQ
jgi:hypothetical protein